MVAEMQISNEVLGSRAEGGVLRLSTFFLPTRREDPAGADVRSHALLVRGGFVRPVGAGLYAWLPWGHLVLQRITDLVREEMLAIGAQEVLFPALLPREYFDASGRWEEYGGELFKLKDRRDRDYLLGPTHEELFTDMVAADVTSYRSLPLSLFQVGVKYRDERRPRAGILRSREFHMKDSYSFDMDVTGMQRSYTNHRAAYVRAFERLEIEFKPVRAFSGPMGGSASEEFLALADAGEDTFVACDSCGFAANVEAIPAATPAPAARGTNVELPPMTTVETPGATSISEVTRVLVDAGYNVTEANVVKVVPIRVNGGGPSELVLVGVPGDRDLDMKRLEAALAPAEVEIVPGADVIEAGLTPGFLGPLVRGEHRFLADVGISRNKPWVVGAGEAHHAVSAVVGRDFEVDEYVGVASVRTGDPCPECPGSLVLRRGVEIGHIFQLGTKYSEAANLAVPNADGEPTLIQMGSYGVGLSRLVAVLVEQHADHRGLVLPPAASPADAHLIVLTSDEAAVTWAVDEFARHGLSLVVDDREGLRAGEKFNDAELMGVPVVIVAGRSMEDGRVEVRDRRREVTDEIPVSEVAQKLVEILQPG